MKGIFDTKLGSGYDDESRAAITFPRNIEQ